MEKYQIINKIQEGGFGVVYKVQDIEKKLLYAMKIMENKSNHIYKIEILNHMKCNDHPNVCKIIETFTDMKKSYIVLELCKTDLFDFINKITFKQLILWIKQISSGIDYIHSNDIVHSDIKMENILIDDKENIKITDFGLSMKLNIINTIRSGTSQYFSPEMLNNNWKATKYIDYWALGILIYDFINSKTPFYNKNKRIMFHNIKNIIWDKTILDPFFLVLCDNLLVLEPENRWTNEHIQIYINDSIKNDSI